MGGILKNPEIKRVLLKLVIFQLILAAVLFSFLHLRFSMLNTAITGQNAALLGKVLGSYPGLEKDIIGLITREATTEQVEAGKKLLGKYGYNQSMPAGLQPVLNGFASSISIEGTGLIIVFLAPLLLLIIYEYGRIYGSIREISRASEKFVEGQICPLPEESEGEFGMLGHSFNQMAGRLKLSLDKEKREKYFLKDIVSDISHQLKTPLSSLITFNELLLDNSEIDTGTRLDFLEKSRAQLEKMEWLIVNLLKLARLEAGAIIFREEKVSLAEPVAAAIRTVNYRLSLKSQTVLVTGDSDNIYFSGDSEWTAEALTNIIKNSSEHTGNAGQICINISETPLFSRISISDNGEGIDKKDLPHIFERFYRGSSSVKAEGVGIGLALAKLIIEGQKGTILVRSEKGKGTDFTITFLKGVL